MYHYVRDPARSRYPLIKGLGVDAFRGQLDFIRRHYSVVGAQDVIRATRDGAPLPPRALLLTFDDGYVDHFSVVAPMLQECQATGCFFPPARAVLEKRVLDVNKIHFVLAAAPSVGEVASTICDAVDEQATRYGLPSAPTYWNRLAKPGRYDHADVIFVKRMLQRELPVELREPLTNALFTKYVTQDEAAFAEELYMSLDQLRIMHQSGMCIGSHGYSHSWMNTQALEEQRSEVIASVEFLGRIGVPPKGWIMCYPYGAWNSTLIELLPSCGCALGMTVEVGVADLDAHHPLTLPRLDTNDLPTTALGGGHPWLAKA
jgi:peptidoglycan/xylan/chitin deacetylase (PgdA/CDA1 family)